MHSTAPRGLKDGNGDPDSEAKKIQELIKRTNVLFCLDCGKCTATCPVAAVKKGFSPRRIVEVAIMEDGENTPDNRYLWDCLTCGKCSNYCPEEVHFSEFVRSLRQFALARGNYSVMNHGGITYSIAEAMTKLKPMQSRTGWVKDTRISDKGDTLLFTGCMVYFDIIFEPLGIEGGPNILNNAVRIMNKAGIVPAVMANEVCCGHDQIWSGDRDTFSSLMDANIRAIKETGAKRVVTVCPECANTLKEDYSKMGGLDIEVLHMAELIEELLTQDKIKLRTAQGNVTYQDPCRLAQHLHVIDPPRTVIKAVNPEGLVEMADTKAFANCCGTTLFRNCDSFSEKMRVERLKQATRTGASTILTACPKCQIHMRCTLSTKCEDEGVDPKLQVKDMITYVAENLED